MKTKSSITWIAIAVIVAFTSVTALAQSADKSDASVVKAVPPTAVKNDTSAAKANPAPTAQNMMPGDKTERHMAYLKQTLKLSDDQAGKVKTMLADSEKKAAADQAKYKDDQKAAQKAMMTLRIATDDKIMSVLDAKQKAEYAKVKDAWWDHHMTKKDAGAPKKTVK